MPKDRSVRTLVAALFFVAALFIAMSYLAEGRAILDWWLPLGLFIVGLAALLLDRTRPAEEDAAPAGGAKAYTVREFTFPDRPAVSAGPEQAGEVNVREPVTETLPDDVQIPDMPTPPMTEAQAETTESVDAPVAAPPAPQKDEVETVDESKTYVERALDDAATAGEFAPPSSAEGVLNPPTESDTVAGAVVQQRTPVQDKDPARSEMPTEPHEVETPEQTQAERLEEKGELLQPADTAENEFQRGEHVAANQPTQSAPPGTTTTGEDMGEGVEPIAPEAMEVLESTAAPPLPSEGHAVDPTHPEVAEEVLGDATSEEVAEALAPSQRIAPTPADQSKDDLTQITGIGPRMRDALSAAGLDSFTRLAAATDEEIRAAIDAAGMRLAPTLSTWREQAGFLARGDRAGFEALNNALRGDAANDQGE